MTRLEIEDLLRDAVESAQSAFAQACATGAPAEVTQATVLNLQHAVIRLNDFILRYIIPEDLKDEEHSYQAPPREDLSQP